MKKKTGSREPGAGSRASQRLCFWQGHSEKVEKSSSKGFFFFFLPCPPGQKPQTHTRVKYTRQTSGLTFRTYKKRRKKKFGKPNKSWKIGLSLSRS